MVSNRASEGSTSLDSRPRRAPIDLTGNSSSDSSPEVQIVRKSAPVAPRYVSAAEQQLRAIAGPSQQFRQGQLPFKPLPALQNTAQHDPRFNRAPPESPTSYQKRQNALNNNIPTPPARPFASTSAAFSTVNSAKQNAFNSMQVSPFPSNSISFIHLSNFPSSQLRLSTLSSDYPL